MNNRYEIQAFQRVQDGSYMALPTGIRRKSKSLACELAQNLANRNGKCETVQHRTSELSFEVRDHKTGNVVGTFEGAPALTVGERGIY